MAGLLEKDFRLLLQRKQMIVLMFLIAVGLSFGQPDSTFVITYVTILGVILATSTISYDEFDNGYSFLMTLPITRKMYVAEKYILGLISVCACVTVAILSCVISFKVQNVEIGSMELIKSGIMILPVAILGIDFMTPVQLKFGAEKSRIVMFLVVGVVAIVTYVTSKFIDEMDMESIIARLDQMPETKVGLSFFGIAVVCTVISIIISNQIMKHKEF